MRESKRKQILTNFIREVWDDGDASATARYLAPRYTIRHDPGDAWDGRTLDVAGFNERLLNSRAAFPDQKFHIELLCADGDAVVMNWLWTATHAGDLPGFPASGKPIRMSGSTTYFFDDDDRLTGHWQIKDALAVFQQLQANRAVSSLR